MFSVVAVCGIVKHRTSITAFSTISPVGIGVRIIVHNVNPMEGKFTYKKMSIT